MAFLAPMIAAAIGIGGTIGTAIVGAGLSFAFAAAARALTPKPKIGAGTSGMRVYEGLDANASRAIPLGRVASAGDLVYRGTFGPSKNEYLHLVYALGDCECDALEAVYMDGKAVAWNSGDETVAEFPGLVWIKFHRGTWDQAADADLVANSGGAITANDRGRGICYVRVKLKYNAEKFQSIPKFVFVFRGARLYDWRKDSTAGGSGAHRWGQPATYEWTDNPVVQLYNWRRGIWINGQRVAGMNTPAAALPVAHWTAAANACDETVALKAGGSEPRYRAGGVISTATRHREVIQDLLSACAGHEIDSGGQIKPFVGVTQPVVASITDDDLKSGAEVKISRKRARNELVNAVFGTYSDPASMYQRRALPPRIAPADEATDGGIRLDEHYALEMVSSQTQGQRVTEIIRRRHRAQARVEITLRSRFAVLEAGDWIAWTSARYGFSAQVFEVTSVQRSADQFVAVTLREVSSSIYSWTTTDELDQLAPAPVQPGGSTFTTMSGLAVALATVSAGGGQSRPGLAINWTQPTDASVVQVAIEYRRVGDAVALSRLSHEPSSGQHVWIDGVQGGTIYEVRIRPVTFPERATAWTGWVAAAAETDPVAVDVEIADGSVTIEKLDAQTRFEIGLATALASLQDGVDGRFQEIYDEVWRASEAATAANAKAFAEREDRRAAVYQEAIARATDYETLAQLISIVETTVGENSAAIVDVSTSLDGVKAQRTIAVNIDGKVTGSITLGGAGAQSYLDFLADVLRFSSPSVSGGAPQALLQVGTVAGSPKMYLNGEMIANAIKAGTVSAGEVSAAFASLGLVRAGRLLSLNDRTDFDLNTGRLRIVATP